MLYNLSEMKKIFYPVIIVTLLICLPEKAYCQQQSANSVSKPQAGVKLYDPSLDGMKLIKEAVSAAKSAGKHVLI